MSTEAYNGLRMQALGLTREQLGLEMAADEPFAVIMETRYAKAVVTLVTVIDGNASLYFSTGGGILGGFAHEAVREAAMSCVTEAGSSLAEMALTSDFTPPTLDHVRFFVLTGYGVFSGEASEWNLAQRRSSLWPLFAQAHEVISELRIVSEQRASDAAH